MEKYELFSPHSYKNLSANAKSEICNGCGPKGKFDFIPDTIYFLDISEACNIHDYMYHVGINKSDKIHADTIFLENLKRIIYGNTRFRILRWLRMRRAKKYYWAVKEFGDEYFYKNKGD